jgi:hypothetical protein
VFHIKNIESGDIIEVADYPKLKDGVWECGNRRFIDDDGTRYEVIEAEPQPTVDKHITRLAFRKRFTQAEKIDIEMASIDDPAAPIDARKQAAALRVDLRDTDSATHIDLARQDTREGVIGLELFGLIGQGRAFAILDAEIQPEERPQ